ncbi:MAG: RES family NAD+ phosphorylase [Gemmobacter sp.]
MNPLPPVFGSGNVPIWRVDPLQYAATWDSGEGARMFGGRWNPAGLRAVYLTFDPSTAILENIVHRGLAELDAKPHVLTRAILGDPSLVHIVMPSEVPNPHWLVPSRPTDGQQAFGAAMLAAHVFVALPSVVSRHSWNVIFDPARAAGRYGAVMQEPVALDPRLHPAP